MTGWARALKSMGGLASILIRPGFQPVSFGLLAARWEGGQPREERGWPAGRGSSRISPQRPLPFSQRTKSDEPHALAQHERRQDPNHNKQNQAPIFIFFFFPPSSAWCLEWDVHRGASVGEGLCQNWLQMLKTRKQKSTKSRGSFEPWKSPRDCLEVICLCFKTTSHSLTWRTRASATAGLVVLPSYSVPWFFSWSYCWVLELEFQKHG